MGTRGLYIVIYKQKKVIVQYGQFDAYPEGQGLNVLDFLHYLMYEPERLDHFKKQLDRCVFVDETYMHEVVEVYAASIGLSLHEDDSIECSDQAAVDQYNKRFPALDREMSSDILNYVYHYKFENELIWLKKCPEDWAWKCEWTYEINIDTLSLCIESDQLDESVEFDLNDLPDDHHFLVCLGQEAEDDTDSDSE